MVTSSVRTSWREVPGVCSGCPRYPEGATGLRQPPAAIQAGGYASPHFNLFRKISKYVLFGG